MSESTEDVQRATADDVSSPAGDAPPVKARQPSQADDVEVVAQAPEPPSAARHDSAVPTSRKLAPPPKPKRDSSSPASVPAPPGDAIAAALAGSDSLRAIGEALAQSVAPSNLADTSLSNRPAVPRPRSSPSISVSPPAFPAPGEPARARDKLPTVPEVSASARPSVGTLAPQRIISIGTRPVEKPPLAPAPALASAPASAAAPVAASTPASAAAPVAVPGPVAVPASATALSAAPAPSSSQAPPPSHPSFPPPRNSAPPPPPLTLDWDKSLEASPVAEHVATAQPPDVELKPAFAPSAPLPAAPEPPPSPLEEPPSQPELPPAAAAPEVTPPPAVPEPAFAPSPLAAAPRAPAEDTEISVDVHVDEAHADIPITTDFDEDTPTLSQLAPATDAALPPQLAALLVPDEPTPAPPPVTKSPEAPTEAEPLAAEERAPDSAEELSREDSPSLPPDAPPEASSAPSAAAPPALPARGEAKPPPPPKRAPAPSAVQPAAQEAEKKKSKQKRAWWEELFSEDFVRANWKVSDEQIKREVTFVEESLGVAPGGVVLDLGCGSGQHAVELASRGYGVVGYDLSLYQLALAADNAQERSQKLNFLQGDMREMAFEEMFDGIFCWNTSFGYFEEDKNYSVAERAFRALRPGGMFLIDVMNRDFVAAHTPSSVWFEGDSCVCMDDAVIDYFTSRLRVKRSVILDDGRTRECTYSVRLYSFHELGKLLHEVGFRVTEVSGHPATPGVFLGQASPRILMLAQRP